MMRGVFGKKGIGATPPGPPPPPAGGASGGGREARKPWQGGADEIAGNLAYAGLAESLPRWIQIDGRVHAETLLAAAGAICGYSCQRAVLRRVAQGEVLPEGQLMSIEGANGQTYFVGDALNNLFFGGDDNPDSKLWRMLSGTAQANGLAPDRTPTSAEIFGPMAARLGGEGEGMPTVPDKHLPHLPIDQLLKLIWPHALECYVGRVVRIGDRHYPAPVQLWPAISAWAAIATFGKTLSLLDPRTAVLILMQSAAFASKLHPKRIEP